MAGHGMKRPRPEDEDGEDSGKQPTGPANGGPQIDKELKKAALDYLEEVKKKFENNKLVYDQFLDIMKDFQSRLINTPGVIERVSDLFKGDRRLILGFNTFLPEGYKIPDNFQELPHQKRRREEAERKAKAKVAAPALNEKPPELEYAKKYVSTIRTRFVNSPKTYQEFLNILQNYQEEQKSVKEVYEQVRILFADHSDLLEEFAKFLPEPNAQPNTEQSAQQARARNAIPKALPASNISKLGKRPRKRLGGDVGGKPKHKEELELMKQLKSHMTRRQWDDMLKVLNLFNAHVITAPQLVQSVRELFSKQPELHESFYQFLLMFCGSSALFVGGSLFSRESEIGPSYTLAPLQTGLPLSSHDSLAADVLNKEVVLKHPCRGAHRQIRTNNSAELALWQAEDDRHELDVLIANIASTISSLAPIVEEIGSLPVEAQRSFELGDSLTQLQIRTIEQLYGDKGSMLVDALYESPGAVIPVVIARLAKQKKQLCSVCASLEQKWRSISSKNELSSLDHCSAQALAEDTALYSAGSHALEDSLMSSKDAIHTYAPLDSDPYVLPLLKQLSSQEEDFVAVSNWWNSFLVPFLELGKVRDEVDSDVLQGDAAGVGMTEGHKEEQVAGDDEAEEEPKAEEKAEEVLTEQKLLKASPEVAALLQVHQQLHLRMSVLKNLVAKATNEGEAGLWDITVGKMLAMAKGQLSKNEFQEWCFKAIGMKTHIVFSIDLLANSFLQRCKSLVASKEWPKIFEAWKTGKETAGTAETLGCVEISFDPQRSSMMMVPTTSRVQEEALLATRASTVAMLQTVATSQVQTTLPGTLHPPQLMQQEALNKESLAATTNRPEAPLPSGHAEPAAATPPAGSAGGVSVGVAPGVSGGAEVTAGPGQPILGGMPALAQGTPGLPPQAMMRGQPLVPHHPSRLQASPLPTPTGMQHLASIRTSPLTGPAPSLSQPHTRAVHPALAPTALGGVPLASVAGISAGSNSLAAGALSGSMNHAGLHLPVLNVPQSSSPGTVFARDEPRAPALVTVATQPMPLHAVPAAALPTPLGMPEIGASQCGHAPPLGMPEAPPISLSAQPGLPSTMGGAFPTTQPLMSLSMAQPGTLPSISVPSSLSLTSVSPLGSLMGSDGIASMAPPTLNSTLVPTDGIAPIQHGLPGLPEDKSKQFCEEGLRAELHTTVAGDPIYQDCSVQSLGDMPPSSVNEAGVPGPAVGNGASSVNVGRPLP